MRAGRSGQGGSGLSRALALILSFACVVSAFAAEPKPAEEKANAGQLFAGQTAETFRKLDRAGASIQWDQIDFELLSATVFHETNRRRRQAGLLPLRDEPKLRSAAEMQARIMAERGSISHVNPGLPDKETPLLRIRLVGLDPAFSAENVATAFGLNYQAGEPVYVREEAGRKFFSREPDGQPLAMHTYLSFAEALLDSWMASPPHREAIVSLEAQFLGTSCQPKLSETGMPMFYCAQVFFAPLAPVKALP